MNRDDALNAECIKVATRTAFPDEWKANAIRIDTSTSISRKLRGEALVHVTKKSGICHAAHITPTQMAAIQGLMASSRRGCRNPRQPSSSKSGPPRRL